MCVWVFVGFMLSAALAGFGLGYAVRGDEDTERLVRAYAAQWLNPPLCENGPGHCSVDLDSLKGAR